MLNKDFFLNESDFDYWNQSAEYRFILRSFVARKFEEFCSEKKRIGIIKGPVHLAIGQESIPACVSEYLNNHDSVFGAHRSHAHYLSLGGSPSELLAEILGSPKGLSSGRGCSMHIFDKKVGFMGSVPIVSGTFALAVGSGFANQYKGNDSISVAYLGDGSFEEGVVSEGLNMARLLRSKILIVVENNQYASHMHLSLRQPKDLIRKLSDSYGIKYRQVDAYDYYQLNQTLKNAIYEIRNEQIPYVVECKTFRWKGHVDWRDDINVGVTRSMEEVKAWKEKCPLNKMLDFYSNEEFLQKLDSLETEFNKILERTLEEAILDREKSASYEELTSHTLKNT